MTVRRRPIAANDPLPPRRKRVGSCAGAVVLVGGLLPMAAWMSFAPLSSAVVAPAYVKVDLNRRPVQHAEGGIVREVLVRDGQQVRQGEPLLVLGDVSVDCRPQPTRLSRDGRARQPGAAGCGAVHGCRGTFSPELIGPHEPTCAWPSSWRRSALFAPAATRCRQVGLLRTQRERVAEEIVALRRRSRRAGESMTFQKHDLETNRKLLKDGLFRRRASYRSKAPWPTTASRSRSGARSSRGRSSARRHRPSYPLAGRRLPPAGERSAEGDGGRRSPRSSRRAQVGGRVGAPGDHGAGGGE